MQRENGRRSFLSKEVLKREDLFRFAYLNGEIYPDPEKDLGGRGYYLKPEEIEVALKKGAFRRILHRELSPSELERIIPYGKKR